MESLETDTIDELRRRIDQVDRDLVQALSRRARLVAQLGRIKRSRGLPIRDVERERVVLASVQGGRGKPYSAPDLARIFRAVLDASLRLMSNDADGSYGMVPEKAFEAEKPHGPAASRIQH